jgi:DNA primase
VIALRQSGFDPVVACMGTALTDQQLRELGRLTRRLWLAFDGDAAGESAALRGMELAVAQGFDVNVVALEPGKDPAEDPSGFEQKLTRAEPYVLYRVRIELERADDREAGFRRAKEILDGYPDGPDKLAAQRLVTDRVGTTVQFKSPAVPSVRAAAGNTRVLDAGDRLEQSALAGVIAFPALKPYLAEMGTEHFYRPENRSLLAHIVEGTRPDEASLKLLAELDARAETEGIDEATARELLVRLRERELRRRLRTAEPAQTKELQEMLTRLLEHAVRPT